jgi:carbohydrate kinase (thermoresistant glucokinase family)
VPLPGVAAVVVMGVSGSGKTTVGRRLADALGWRFQEGDDLHPAANVAKMHAGIPLDDADRRPWLASVAAVIDSWRRAGTPGVVACSALKRAYRDVIVGGHDDVRLVYLRGSRALLAERLQARQGHYMPASLLDSQLATLEEPAPEERALTVDDSAAPEAIVATVLARLRAE